MECIVCGKKTNKEICRECNKLLSVIHKNNPRRKKQAIKQFREFQRKKNEME